MFSFFLLSFFSFCTLSNATIINSNPFLAIVRLLSYEYDFRTIATALCFHFNLFLQLHFAR